MQPDRRRLLRVLPECRLLGHLRLPVTGSRKRRGTTRAGPFRVADPQHGIARIPTLPDNDLDGPVEPVVAEGLFLSSELGADASTKKIDRQRATIRAFQLRARHRTTPQGVFAAVADLRYDDGPLSLGGVHRTRTYPNPVWLHILCDRAMDNPDVLRGLRFHTNNLTVQRGDRLHVQRPAADARSRPDHVSIRASAPVSAIIDACRQRPATWAGVIAALHRQWPTLSDETAGMLLRDLVRNGFILTDLAPDDACNDPTGHVLAKIATTDPLNETLSWLRSALGDADSHAPGSADRMTALTKARRITDELAPTWRPLSVDCATDATIRIPAQLATQGAEAANVLWRITSHRDRFAGWHSRFIHRYGTRRLVPLLDACDPVMGLGTTLDDPDPGPDASRHAVLTRMLSEALMSARTEVNLTADLIDALNQRAPGDRAEASTELYTRVIARDQDDRDNGRYFLAVTNRAAPAGSTRSRFAGLLPDLIVDLDDGQGPMVAELVFQAQSHAVASLSGNSPATPWRIPIAVTPEAGDLPLSDLALVCDGQRLHLWSTQHHRPVRPLHRNQIGHHLMPDLAAFLCALGQSGTVPLGLWDWGSFNAAPFLPRVRYRDTIVSPARWRLPDALVQAAEDRTAWDAALTAWRTATHPVPPSVVAVADTDRQLPIELDRDDDRELLRRYVTRGVTTVVEQPGGPDAVRGVVAGPNGYHGLEVVIPLTTVADPEPVTPPERAQVREAGTGLHLPGGEWLSLAITAPPLTQDDILGHIAELVGDTERLWDRWFWLRYRTNALGPHLRIRFHGKPDVLNSELLQQFNDLCGRLVDDRLSSGFTVEPYAPEIERYGGPEALDAVEDVFGHDSLLCLELLRADREPDARIAASAVSAAAITRIVADTNLSALEPYRLTGTDRTTFNRLRPLARHLGEIGYLGSPDTWHTRTAALHNWRNLLPVNRTIDCASSAVHMHVNRMVGDTDTERIVRALAKDLIARTT